MPSHTSRFLNLWRTGVVQLELFHLQNVPREELVARFGKPAAGSDQYDCAPSPSSYWLLAQPCGLKLVLQAYQSGGQGSLVVHADEAEFRHIRHHLAPLFKRADAWTSLDGIAQAMGQDEFWPDDNWAVASSAPDGQERLHAGLSEREARCLLRTLMDAGDHGCRLLAPLSQARAA